MLPIYTHRNNLADYTSNTTLHLYQLGFSQGSLILSISLGEFVNNIVNKSHFYDFVSHAFTITSYDTSEIHSVMYSYYWVFLEYKLIIVFKKNANCAI